MENIGHNRVLYALFKSDRGVKSFRVRNKNKSSLVLYQIEAKNLPEKKGFLSNGKRKIYIRETENKETIIEICRFVQGEWKTASLTTFKDQEYKNFKEFCVKYDY